MTAAVVAVAMVGRASPPVSVHIHPVGSCEGTEAVVGVRGEGVERSIRIDLSAGNPRATLGVTPSQAYPLELSTSAEGCWAAPVRLEDPPREPVDIRLWPASGVRAEIDVADGRRQEIPARLRLNLATVPAADSSGQPEFTVVHCETDGDLLPPCTVPAGRWRIRVQATDWVPWYVWDLRLEPGSVGDLGTVTLRRGGSLTGRVVTTSGVPAEAVVSVGPVVGASESSEDDLGFSKGSTRSASVGPWGWFSLGGLSPGRYVVRAESPGYAPAAGTIDIDRHGETTLDEPLVLSPKVRAEVEVLPAVPRSGERWTIRMVSVPDPSRSQSVAKIVAEGLTRMGRWLSRPVSPGPYRVEVRSPAGERMAVHDIDLVQDLQRETVELDLVSVLGHVRLGEREIGADLWFGGKTGDERVRARTERGEGFHVVLPRAGEWAVHVACDDPPVDRSEVSVEVVADSERRCDDLVIELPDTTLEGEVVDESGRSVPDAGVRVVKVRPYVQAGLRTDGTGWFRTRGLEAGTYQVEAVSGSRRSDTVRVTLTEETIPPPLKLVLHESTPLQGVVTADGHPVTGVRVLAYPFGVSGAMVATALPQATSGADGRFEIDLPGPTVSARLVALAPGFVLSLLHVDVERVGLVEDEIEIRLRRGGGTLRLERGDAEKPVLAVVYVAGQPIDAPLLMTWAQMNGVERAPEGGLDVPALPVGRYAACSVTPDEARLVISGVAVPRADRCVEGVLSEGSTLVLETP